MTASGRAMPPQTLSPGFRVNIAATRGMTVESVLCDIAFPANLILFSILLSLKLSAAQPLCKQFSICDRDDKGLVHWYCKHIAAMAILKLWIR